MSGALQKGRRLHRAAALVCLCAAVICAGTAGAGGQDRAKKRQIDMDEMKVHGDRALPRMMYVVPWKRSTLPDLTKPTPQDALGGTLAPLRPGEFGREVRYYQARENAAKATPAPR